MKKELLRYAYALSTKTSQHMKYIYVNVGISYHSFHSSSTKIQVLDTHVCQSPNKTQTLMTQLYAGVYGIHGCFLRARPCENMSYAICEQQGADQPMHPRRLHSTFVVRCLNSIICILAISKDSRFLLASVAEQAGLNLIWSNIPENTFSRDVAHKMFLTVAFGVFQETKEFNEIIQCHGNCMV